MVKKIIKACIHRFGYTLERVSPLESAYPSPLPGAPYLNIGAGPFRQPGWTIIDKLHEYYKADQSGKEIIDLDLLDCPEFPLKDACMHGAYSSHVVEHLSDESVANLFAQTRRVLRKGSVFRVVAPCADLAVVALRADDRSFFSCYFSMMDRKKVWENYFLSSNSRNMSTSDMFMHHIYTQGCPANSAPYINPNLGTEEFIHRIRSGVEHESELTSFGRQLDWNIQRKNPQMHCNWWNENKLTKMLREAGFSSVRRSAYGQSADPVLRNVSIFDNTEPSMSVFMEAVA